MLYDHLWIDIYVTYIYLTKNWHEFQILMMDGTNCYGVDYVVHLHFRRSSFRQQEHELRMKVPTVSILFLELPLLGSAFSTSGWTTLAMSTDPNSHSSALLSSSSSFSSSSFSSSSSSYPSESSSQDKITDRVSSKDDGM